MRFIVHAWWIAALEAAVTEVESKISGMYTQPELQCLKYCLHAVMVHEGGVESGHYWAYVRDHKRKVRNTQTHGLLIRASDINV